MSNSFMDEPYTLIRKPLDPGTSQPLEDCRYALFPGAALAQSEPELVVLMYDSILHQYPDTAMFLCKGREGADPLLNRKWSERLLSRWRNLGKPTMMITTPEDMKFFRRITTEIPTVSIYDILLKHHISGGCSRELYRISEPTQYGSEPAIRELAENMGAVLYEAAEAGKAVSSGDAVRSEKSVEAEHVAEADIARIPFLTSSIDIRNAMKKHGFEAVHILELIYGMGRSNQHLAHIHAEGHDHSHDAPPQIRNTRMNAEEEAALAALFSPADCKQNLQELHDTLLAMFWNE